MEEPEFSCTILSKLNLYDIEKIAKEAYHKEESPGRLARKPMGIFKALIVKQLQQIPTKEKSADDYGKTRILENSAT